MHPGVKIKNHNYTLEIIRCIDMIISQVLRGWSVKEAVIQAEQSYGYSISLNARRALYKSLNK